MAKAPKKPVANKKAQSRPKLTDADRHARFVETARKVGADERPEEFDKVFTKIARHSRIS